MTKLEHDLKWLNENKVEKEIGVQPKLHGFWSKTLETACDSFNCIFVIAAHTSVTAYAAASTILQSLLGTTLRHLH